MNNELETDGERIRERQIEGAETNGLKDKLISKGSNNMVL